MILTILRGLFLLLVATVTALYLYNSIGGQEWDFNSILVIMACGLGLAFLIIGIDVFTPNKKLSALSGVILGLIAGLLAAYAAGFFVDFVALLTAPEVTISAPRVGGATNDRVGAEPLALDATGRGQADDSGTGGPGRPIYLTPPPARPTTEALTQPSTTTQPSAAAERGRGIQIVRQRTYEEQVRRRQSFLNLVQGVKVVIGLITCYLGISLVLQTKGDFRFVIPYVEFAKDVRGARPTILDTSVIIDGRIVEIVQARLMQVGLIIPRFVLQELHTLADSTDRLKRARGRRGLDVLQKLQATPVLDITILDADAEGAAVDQKLVSLARQLNARIMTNDFNLNKIATLRGITVINLNDLAAAMRPVVLPGEPMRIKVIKPGEGAHQGVGYLEDGTMVVVENARHLIGQETDLVVTSSLQTSAGRMIFGRNEAAPPLPAGRADSRAETKAAPAPGSAAAPAPGAGGTTGDTMAAPASAAPAPDAGSATTPAAQGTPAAPLREDQNQRPGRPSGNSGRNPRRSGP